MSLKERRDIITKLAVWFIFYCSLLLGSVELVVRALSSVIYYISKITLLSMLRNVDYDVLHFYSYSDLIAVRFTVCVVVSLYGQHK